MISTFYTQDGKTVKPSLFDDEANNIASSFVITEKDKDGRTFVYGVSKTQLRRLFDEVKRFEQNLNGESEVWQKHLPYIRMIKSKVSYNTSRAKEKERKKEKVYNNLSDFITKGIDLIKKEEDYYVFLALFEAVYGFYYEKNPKDD